METLQQFLVHSSGFESYLIFFCLVTASCIGLFNSDIAFITAGALSGMGFFDARILILLGFIALMTGDSITFFSGRKWGRSLVQKRPFRFVINDQKMDVAESFFKKRGLFIVFMIRFLPLLRTALFMTSGSLRVDPKKFYLLNGMSTMIYLPLVIIGSNRASSNAAEIIQQLKKFQFVPALILMVMIAYFYFKKKCTTNEVAR